MNHSTWVGLEEAGHDMTWATLSASNRLLVFVPVRTCVCGGRYVYETKIRVGATEQDVNQFAYVIMAFPTNQLP